MSKKMNKEESYDMDWSLVQPRNYDDTFDGGDYHRDMRENPELQPQFPAVGCGLSGEYYQTEHQKALHRMWNEKSDC